MADIADVTSGQSPPSHSYNQDGVGMEFHQGKKHFGDSSLNAPGVWTTEVTRKALPGDIVMSVRAPVGPINYVEREVCIGRGLASIRPNESIMREFLAKFLVMNEGRINGHVGATFNSINKKEIEGILVPLPPLEEQERIVEVLDEAFAAIDKAKANIERNLTNARELFQSRLNEIFSNPSEDWEVKPLGAVCGIVADLIDPRLDEYSSLLHVGGGNIESGSGQLIDLKTSAEEGLKSGKFPFTTEDVLYNKIRPYLVKVARPSFRGICSADMYPLRPSEYLTRDFLFYVLISERFTSYAKSVSARAGMPKVNRKDLFNYIIAFPPKNRQEQIAMNLDSLSEKRRKLEENYQTELDNLEELRQSILEQAFAGKLTAEFAEA